MTSNWLRLLVKDLVAANTAVPIVLDTIGAITLLVKAATGSGPTLAERAAIIREEVAANDAYGHAALATIDALIAAQPD